MTKAIEHIVAGYSTLKNRKALEEIRDHRKRLLMENRMSAASSGFNLDRIICRDDQTAGKRTVNTRRRRFEGIKLDQFRSQMAPLR